MRAPYAKSKPIDVATLELQPPGPGEILVQIKAAGVCHSDLSVVNGSRPRPIPMLLGHEASAQIIELGDGVVGLRPGQRVVMTFLPRCGECDACATNGRIPCSRGTESNSNGTLLSGALRLSRNDETVFHHLGVSGFATHAVVDHRSVVPIDEDVPFDVAALLGCAVLTGGGAVLNVAQPMPGESIMVVGLGGVGMAAVLAAASQDGVSVIGVDNDQSKLQLANDLGANLVCTPEDVKAHRITASHAVEAAGHPSALELAFEATAPGGRTVTVGLPDPDSRISIDPLTLTAQTRSLVGSYLGSSVPSRDIPTYVDLWRRGRLPIERLVSHHLELGEINGAFDALASGSALRQMIMF